MSHLDDSLIAELIDGELDTAARAAATAHLAACAECRARHAEALACSGEADRLIAAVGLPRPLRPLRSRPAPAAGHMPRRIPWRTLGWAASVILAVGIGYYAGVPGYGVPMGLEDSGATSARQGVEADRKQPTVTAESTRLSRQEALSQDRPAASPAAEAGAPGRLDESRANEMAPAEPAPATAKLALRDRTQPLAPQAGALATDPARSGRTAPPESKAESAPPSAALAVNTAGAATVVSLEGAVNRLGGSIRLIDGLTPAAVRLIVASQAAAAAEGDATVRVVYLDPPSREIWLDQRRISPADSHARDDIGLLLGDTIDVVLRDGRRSLQWRDPEGFRLFLSGFLPADSLHMLARRVR